MIQNSSHVEEVKQFMNDANLYSIWRDFPVDSTHTFQREDGNCYAHTLDHILVLNSTSEQIIEAGVLHLVQNLLDNEPIYCV